MTTYAEVRRPPQAGAARHRRPTVSTNYRRSRARRRGVRLAATIAPKRVGKRAAAAYARTRITSSCCIRSRPTANLNELYVTVGEESAVRAQGRARDERSRRQRARAVRARRRDLATYYNTRLAGGKWIHMMDQTHIGYTYWQEPPRNTMPRVDRDPTPAMAPTWASRSSSRIGPPVAGRGGRRRTAAGLRASGARCRRSIHISGRRIHLDVYNRGQTPFAFSATAERAVGASSRRRAARSTTEQRLAVTSTGRARPTERRRCRSRSPGRTKHASSSKRRSSNPASPSRDAVVGFVEGDGYVSIEAEHYHARRRRGERSSGCAFRTSGKTLSGDDATPVTVASADAGRNAPHLEYRVFMFDSGTVKVHALPLADAQLHRINDGLRYAVSFDDERAAVVDAQAGHVDASVGEARRRQHRSSTSTQHACARPGEHVLKFWMRRSGHRVSEVRDRGAAIAAELSRSAGELLSGSAGASDRALRLVRVSRATTRSTKRLSPATPTNYLNPILAGLLSGSEHRARAATTTISSTRASRTSRASNLPQHGSRALDADRPRARSAVAAESRRRGYLARHLCAGDPLPRRHVLHDHDAASIAAATSS